MPLGYERQEGQTTTLQRVMPWEKPSGWEFGENPDPFGSAQEEKRKATVMG